MRKAVEPRRATRAHAAAALFLLALVGCSSAGAKAPQPKVVVPSLSQDQLQRAKLYAEIDSLESATKQQNSGSSQWLRWAPFITVLVAAGTLLATLIKQAQDTKVARQKASDDRDKAAEEAVRERQRREDATVAATVQNLGSDNAQLRLNAAAALTASLRLSSSTFTADDLLTVIIANLRAESDQNVLDVLVDDLEVALICLHENDRLLPELDLTRTNIRRMRIPAMELHGVDIAFSLLQDCNFSGCTLRRLRGFNSNLSETRFSQANLHEARLNGAICERTRFDGSRLVSATFKGAALRGARFRGADLQGAHFESADCTGAAFTDADLADTWFCDSSGNNATQLDDSALLSIRKAHRWRQAHLSTAHRSWLDALPV